MSKTSHGVTKVTLGDDELTLSATLKNVRSIEQRFGGLAPALHELTHKINLNSLATVILIGSGRDYKSKDIAAMEEQIYEAGINKVNPQVVPYLVALLNPSGKSEEELAEAAEAADKAESGNE